MDFVFVSGRPSLDLLGTLKWRRKPAHEQVEQLSEPGRVAEWAMAAGLVDEPVPVSQPDWRAVLELREAIYRLITAAREGRRYRSADRDLLNFEAAGVPVRLQLTGRRLQRRATAAQLRASLARDALELLGTEDLSPLKQCANEPCTRLYLDHSRSGNRRWCGMAECGNRYKVAEFRRRHAEPRAAADGAS